MNPTQQQTAYARLGGEPAVRALVERFYELMDTLPEAQELRRLHPDMERAADSLFKFLSGWFGGPPLYQRERGHPRLRMRHLPFAIGPAARDQWLLCMRRALAEQVADEPLRTALDQAFAGMAEHMVNRA
ncbi:MAG TPA: group II truncated hemoglobin [Rubrivivax sp.]|jgi:hemoglobin|nr:group II truncated hemoglobin [Rubrivivax sp.]